jgi:CDP-6-deoxy-D-xylo-4-hexulose-3-dehydrase
MNLDYAVSPKFIEQVKWFYPTAFSVWGNDEYDAIRQVIASGRFTMGEQVAAFEREFADFHGMRYAIMTNSGSSANLVAVAALFNLVDRPLRRGQRVIVPAIAWSTTYAPLIQYGLEPVLADCDETWNAKVLKDWDVALVVACSILGNPGYLQAWQDYCESRRAYLIEDNCESLGSRTPMDNKLCGTFGLMNTFSFFYSHQISAIEGGMILTNSEECYALCRMLRAHGWSRDIEKPRNFDYEYDFRVFGYNVRPLEMHAAVGRQQLWKLAKFREQRISNVGLFRRLTEDLPITHQMLVGQPDPFGLSFFVKDNEARRRLALALRAAGIDCRLPTGGSFRLHRYGRKWAEQKTPFADRIHRQGMFLGNGPLDLSEQITAAVRIMKVIL